MKNFFINLFILILSLTEVHYAQIRPGEDISKYPINDSKPSTRSNNAYLERVSSLPYGPSISIAVDSLRQLIFAGSGGAVLILDGSDPANLQLLTDTLRTDGLVEDIAYDDVTQRLYFACGDGGFEIWDVQNPSQPFRFINIPITYFAVPTPVRHVQIRNNIAVVECSWGYVHSINVSDPYNPFEQGFNGTMGNPSHDIYAEPEEYLHTTGQNGYYRLYMDGTGNLYGAGNRYFTYGANAVFGTHDLAFVGYSSYMYILDLHTSAFEPWSITNVGGAIYHIEVRNNFAYIINVNGFSIWNVSDPANPFWLSTIPLRYYPVDFTLGDNYAYVSIRDDGFDIVDIRDPGNPSIAGSYETLSSTLDTEVDGNFAYLAHSDDGVLIADISNLNYPVIAGQYDTPGMTYDATFQNNIIYVADWDGGFRIADVSNPANPVELSYVQGFNAWRVEVAGNYAYVIEGVPNVPDNLRIFDVSNPSSPVQVSMMSTPGETNGIVYQNNYLFLASNDAGFRVIDVSDPYNPVTVSTLAFPTYVNDLYVRGNYAYVISLGIGGPVSGFHIVDISDPENPFQTGEYLEIGLSPFNVQVSGDFAYVADDHDIAAFLISDPSNPTYLESFRTYDRIFGEFAIDSLIFVADAQAGLQIFRNIQFGQPGGGLYWHTQLAGTSEGFYSIFFTDLNNGWAAGYSGMLYNTTNGGDVWNEQSSITGEDILSIYFSSPQKGWFVGTSGKIFNTTDGGNIWQPQISGTSDDLYDITFVDDMNGWVVGDNIILHSSNGGSSWSSQSFPPGYLNGFISVDFVDLLHGWIAVDGEFGTIVKTTNGGNTWTFITGLSSYSLYAVDFVNENTGYFVGMFGAIIKTTDGGNTWITQPDPPPHDWLYGVHFLDEQKGWAVGFNGKVIFTSDGGNNWRQQTAGTTAQLNCVYFLDETHGWAVGEDALFGGGVIINYSTEIIPVELTSFTATVDKNNVTLFWSTATETNNSGFEIEKKKEVRSQKSEWERIGFVKGYGTTTEEHNYFFVDKNLSAGHYQYRLKQIDYDGSYEYSKTMEISLEVPAEFSLSQNYPNPFNPTTKIKYRIPQSVIAGETKQSLPVSLKVYDVLGNEIATLVNKEQSPGEYEINFNAAELSTGVYFYQLKAGNFTDTKKMILLR